MSSCIFYRPYINLFSSCSFASSNLYSYSYITLCILFSASVRLSINSNYIVFDSNNSSSSFIRRSFDSFRSSFRLCLWSSEFSSSAINVYVSSWCLLRVFSSSEIVCLFRSFFSDKLMISAFYFDELNLSLSKRFC